MAWVPVASPEDAAEDERRGRRLDLLAAGGLAAGPLLLTIVASWRGDSAWHFALLLLLFVAGGALLALGVVVLSTWLWNRASFRRHRRVYVLAAVVLASWLANLPVASWIEGWSESVTKDRAVRVAEAADAVLRRTGRVPVSLEDLRAASGESLSGPTWGAGFLLRADGSGVVVSYSKHVGFFGLRTWEYSSVTREWRESFDH